MDGGWNRMWAERPCPQRTTWENGGAKARREGGTHFFHDEVKDFGTGE